MVVTMREKYIIVVLSACFFALVWFFRKKNDDVTPNEQVLEAYEKAKNSDSSFSSLSTTDIVLMADKLDTYLLRSVTEDEWAAMSVIKKCKTAKDWNNLVLQFGERKPTGFFRDALTLPAALLEYLQDSEYRAIVTYIKSIGGVL